MRVLCRAGAAWIGASALAAGLPAGAADTADAHQKAIERLAPAQRPAYLQHLVAQQQARSAQSLGPDVTGPVLTAFNVPTTLNLAKSAAPFKVALKATDDLSGVLRVYFFAEGPSGQTLTLYASSGFPLASFALPAGISSLSRLIEPGTWNVTYGYGYDAAGNVSYFDQPALQALGNTSFAVVNNGGYDKLNPTLVDGKILTPTVSLSAFAPGTSSEPPYVQVKVNATDPGDTAVAGLKQVVLYFCKVAKPDVCIYPSASTYATAQGTMSFFAGTQVSAANGTVTGTYELAYVNIYDHADNATALVGTKFGGPTNFSTLFPSGTTIKVQP